MAGKSIGIFNIEGEFFALRNRCPHQGGPLCEGTLESGVESPTPGEYIHERPGEFLRCPWHGWEFDIKTGQSWFNPSRIRTKKYKTRVQTLSDIGRQDAPGAAATERLKGPFSADVVNVSVEDHFIVLELLN